MINLIWFCGDKLEPLKFNGLNTVILYILLPTICSPPNYKLQKLEREKKFSPDHYFLDDKHRLSTPINKPFDSSKK